MIEIAVIGLSTALQFIAAGLALRLIALTERWVAWILIAAAMVLMGVRRLITLYRTIFEDAAPPPDMTAEWVALAISVLVAGGMLMMGPLLRRMHDVSQELQKSEERFRDFAESSSDWLWEMGPDFRVTYVSDRVVEITGHSVESNIGKTRMELAIEDVDTDRWRAHQETLDRHEPFKEFHYQRFGPDGKPQHIVTSGVPIFDADGVFQGYRGTASDMTERERLRDSLVASEDLMTSLFENVPVALIIKDADHIVERINRTYLEWYGLRAEDMLGRRSQDVEGFQPDDDADAMNAQETEVISTGETRTRQIERSFADGSMRTLKLTKFPVYDRAGNVTKVGTVTIDLTEQLTAQRELERQSSFLDSIIENMPNMVFVKDAEDLRFTLFNRAGEELHGIKREDLIGKSDFDIVPEEQAEFFVAKDREVLAAGGIIDISEEPINTKAKGQRLLHTKKIAIRDPDGKPRYLLGISEDITDRRRIEQELAQSLEAATRANQAKSEFLAHMSHELRTPLNSVIGFTQVITGGIFGEPSEKHREYLRLIQVSAEHLLDVINDILDLSRLEAGEIALDEAVFPVSAPINDATGFVSIMAREKGLRIDVEPPPQEMFLHADQRMVRQILVNLVSNATKFTPESGRVWVRAEPGDNGGIVFTVADTGPGIPQDDIPKIMEPFGQARSNTDTAHEGTGLGLSISKRLADLHGAELTLESQEGVGTTVRVAFPESRTAEPPS